MLLPLRPPVRLGVVRTRAARPSLSVLPHRPAHLVTPVLMNMHPPLAPTAGTRRLAQKLRHAFVSALLLGVAAVAGAAPENTGTIRGRVLNSETGEYIYNAQI